MIAEMSLLKCDERINWVSDLPPEDSRRSKFKSLDFGKCKDSNDCILVAMLPLPRAKPLDSILHSILARSSTRTLQCGLHIRAERKSDPCRRTKS